MAEGSGGWSTIESDEGLFTSLIETLGVEDVQFEELISLDADTIRSLSPVYGLIFLFKWIGHGGNSTDAPLDGTYAKDAPTDPSHPLFFAHQTIQNACGTQALLSIILNQDTKTNPENTDYPIDLGSTLGPFKEFTAGFPPSLLGDALSNSEEIRAAHNSFARSNPFVDETVKDPRMYKSEDVYHFIAYTPVNGVLYELDGLQPHPISHGPCSFASFPDAVIPVLQRRIARYDATEIGFNLMAVTRDLRIRALETDDGFALEREERKRKGWRWENALRRWNFVGFVGEVGRGVVGQKVKDGKYDEWVDEATKESVRRRMER